VKRTNASTLIYAVLFASLAFWGIRGLISSPAWAVDRSAYRWPNHYEVALGQPLHRATVYLDAGVNHDTLATDGGAVTTYTFTGGEHVCVQGSIDFCFEPNKVAAGMTADCAKAVKVLANAERCFFLQVDAGVIGFSTTTGTGTVKVFETRM